MEYPKGGELLGDSGDISLLALSSFLSVLKVEAIIDAIMELVTGPDRLVCYTDLQCWVSIFCNNLTRLHTLATF